MVLGLAAGAPPVNDGHICRWRCRAARRAGLQLCDRPLRQRHPAISGFPAQLLLQGGGSQHCQRVGRSGVPEHAESLPDESSDVIDGLSGRGCRNRQSTGKAVEAVIRPMGYSTALHIDQPLRHISASVPTVRVVALKVAGLNASSRAGSRHLVLLASNFSNGTHPGRSSGGVAGRPDSQPRGDRERHPRAPGPGLLRGARRRKGLASIGAMADVEGTGCLGPDLLATYDIASGALPDLLVVVQADAARGLMGVGDSVRRRQEFGREIAAGRLGPPAVLWPVWTTLVARSTPMRSLPWSPIRAVTSCIARMSRWRRLQ